MSVASTKFHLLIIKLFEQIGQPWFDACTPNSAYIAIRTDSQPYDPDEWTQPFKYYIFVRVIDGVYQYYIIGSGGNTLFSQTKVDMDMDCFIQLIVDIHKDFTVKWQDFGKVDKCVRYSDRFNLERTHTNLAYQPEQIDFTYSINASPKFIQQSKISEFEIVNTPFEFLT